MTKQFKFNQKEMRAYNEGFDVFEMFMSGAPMLENPHKNGSRLHAAWKEGFDEARESFRAAKDQAAMLLADGQRNR